MVGVAHNTAVLLTLTFSGELQTGARVTRGKTGGSSLDIHLKQGVNINEIATPCNVRFTINTGLTPSSEIYKVILTLK